MKMICALIEIADTPATSIMDGIELDWWMSDAYNLYDMQ
jgi:hypothetical protein